MTSYKKIDSSRKKAHERKKESSAVRDTSSHYLPPEKHPRRMRALKARRASSMS